MASIWDLFNGNATPEQNAGLLGLAAGFNGALGDGSRPVNFGQALAAGALGMQQNRNAYTDRQREQEMAQQQAALRALQMRATGAEVSAAERAAQLQERIQASALTASQNGQFNPEAFINDVRTYDPLTAEKYAQQFAKAAPEFDTKPQTAIGEDGKPFQYIIAKNGEIKRLDGVLPRDEVKWLNLDNRMVAASPYAPAGTALDFGVSPSAQLSANVAMRGQNMTDTRAREANSINRDAARTQVINDPNAGLILVDKGTGQARVAVGADGQPLLGSEKMKTQVGAQKLLPVIKQAKELIGEATGSYGGAAYDQAARVVGLSTPGAQATAKLKVLESQLILNQPRLEGPQSDRDTMLYRQAAGQIGDPTVPRSQKLAAIAEIEDITRRNAGVAAQTNQPKAQQAAPRAPMKGQVVDGYRFKGGNPADPNNWERK